MDGKVLGWSMKNKLTHPIRGGLTSKTKLSKRTFSSCPGITAIAYPQRGTSNSSLATAAAAATASSKFQWMLLGLEGGGVLRVPSNKFINTSTSFSKETFKILPSVEELYNPLRSETDKFSYEKHIGSISSLEISPFNKNVFLSAGNDGFIKLFHFNQPTPIFQWEPCQNGSVN
jgi:WD40 repeat protein